MSWACWNFTTSMVTMREIGIRLLYRIMKVRMSRIGLSVNTGSDELSDHKPSMNSFAVHRVSYMHCIL